MPRRATLVPRQQTRMPAWAIVAVTLTGVGVVITAGFIGLVWCVASVIFRPADPERATMAVVEKEMTYDETSHLISGKLERHFEFNSTAPIDVTVIAYTPDGPAEGVRLTRRFGPKTTAFSITLSDEQATAFAHPVARRTISLRQADGQLVRDEKPWRTW